MRDASQCYFEVSIGWTVANCVKY